MLPTQRVCQEVRERQGGQGGPLLHDSDSDANHVRHGLMFITLHGIPYALGIPETDHTDVDKEKENIAIEMQDTCQRLAGGGRFKIRWPMERGMRATHAGAGRKPIISMDTNRSDIKVGDETLGGVIIVSKMENSFKLSRQAYLSLSFVILLYCIKLREVNRAKWRKDFIDFISKPSSNDCGSEGGTGPEDL